MKNKLKILGILIVMAIALCGAFSLNVPKYVFAEETSAQESTPLDEAGTFVGMGSYDANVEVTLKATPNVGYDFYWLLTYADDNEVLGDDKETLTTTEEGYKFTTDRPVEISVVTKKAGTFKVEGSHATADGAAFFIVGKSATLVAEMEPGFIFKGWATPGADGTLSLLPDSASTTYVLEITQNITVVPTWEKEEYSVTLASGLDTYFKKDVVNNSQLTGVNHYGDEMQITISLNEDLYVADLNKKDVKVNNVNLDDIADKNPMGVEASITNDDEGFDNIIITLNIKENVQIDIDYVKMFVLEIESGNSVSLDDIYANEFISSSGYYKQIEDSYKYLLCESVEMNLLFSSGNDVYSFYSYQLEEMSEQKSSYSAAFSIRKNRKFTITYNVNEYQISFKPYLNNLSGGQDPMAINLYNIKTEIVKPGEKVEYAYNSETKAITVTGANGTPVLYGVAGIYGYEFKGFKIGDDASSQYTMSATEPKDVEVKLIFEYVGYTFSVELSDDYFEPYVELVVSDDTGLNAGVINDTYSLIKGASVTIKASTSKYQINGWASEDIALPTEGTASTLLAAGYTFIFEPSEKAEYVITINVGFKYTTAQFALDDKGCVYDESQSKYSANIQISYVDNVNVVLNVDNTATITLSGTTYTMDEYTTKIGVIESFTTEELIKEDYTYKTSYQGYEIYIHVAGDDFAEGDKFILRNRKTSHESVYEYVEGEGFVLHNADTAPDTIGVDRIIRSAEYGIKLNNLLPNAMVIYGSKLTDSSYYRIVGYSSLNGTGLGYYIGSEDYANCLLPLTMINGVKVRYVKLEEVVYLAINDLNAYKFGDVSATKNGETIVWKEEINDNTSLVSFEATDLDQIEISIKTSKIATGYKFDGYSYGFDLAEGDKIDGNTFKFVMDNDNHKTQIISINFSEIEYNVVLDISGQGRVKIGEFQSNAKLTINNNYDIIATANPGYYVSNAYVGSDTEANKMGSLMTNNSSTETITSFVLNEENFVNYIVNNAYKDGDIWYVDLKVVFTGHTYNVKTYFTLPRNGGMYKYPTVYINNQELALQNDTEGVIRVYFAEATNIDYGNSVIIEIDTSTSAEGIEFDALINEKGESLDISSDGGIYKYVIDSLSKNIEYTIQLKFTEYQAVFKAVDTLKVENRGLGEGSVIDNANKHPITLGSTVSYQVWANAGYTLIRAYYEDKLNDISELDITERKILFNPAQFKLIGKTFTIYLMFDYIEIDLQIKNQLDEGKGAFVGKQPKDLAGYTVFRNRDGNEEYLTEDNCSVRADDEVIFTITPSSIGIALDKLTLHDSDYGIGSGAFSVINIYDQEGNFAGVYYQVKIKFTSSLIQRLYQSMGQKEEAIQVTNWLSVRTYDFIYSYNYISYEFGVELEIQAGRESWTGQKDTSMTQKIAFGSDTRFTHGYAVGVENNQFKVKGFLFNGEDFKDEILVFNKIDKWTELALEKYENNDNIIEVQLILTPSIFLENCTKVGEDYVYSKIYNAKQQGLNTNPDDLDVTVGGGFEVFIRYSYDGIEYHSEMPTNAGTYPVTITALIKTDISEPVEIEYNENVILIIKQKEVTLALNPESVPITKVYDGLKAITAPDERVVPYIVLNGICDEDKGNVFINDKQVYAEFSGLHVNTDGLYNLSIRDLYLVDSVMQPANNYTILTGTSIMFENVGQIKQCELKLVGVVAYDKVNDGSTTVSVNIEKLTLSGTLGNDVTQIMKENIKFYHDEVNKKYKGPIDVKMSYEDALIGADSINYTIAWDPIKINMYPYELEYYINGVGTFKIVDYDKKCLIPLNCNFTAKAHERGSSEYSRILSLTETHILKSENLNTVYEVILQDADGVNQAISEGLYIYLPAVSKITKVFQKINNEKAQAVDYVVKDGFLIVKSQEGRTAFGVVVKTTYLPLWVIILIVVGSIAGVGLIVLVFILVRRKIKRKYQRFDKI